MTLAAKRVQFTALLGRLLAWCAAQGHDVALDEAYRPPETARLYANQGRGLANSLHCSGLAVDINLYVAGVYQIIPGAYGPLGVYWESLDPACRWGGRFAPPDARHFSLAHEGRS